MSDALIDGHDAALFDLDGVVYLGPDPVPAAPDTCLLYTSDAADE